MPPSTSGVRSDRPGLRRARATDNHSGIPTVSANGIDVYYERRGDGPRLLFLNGSGSTLATSALLIAPFAQGFDVVAHDQRGLGKTEIPPGPYSMADYAADALALMDEVGWAQCRVVGVSFGGMVAQELAVTAPERVERLALCCTSPGGAGGASYPLQELAELSAAERAARSVELLDTRFDDDWLASHPADRGLAEMMAARRSNPAEGSEARRGETEQLAARSRHDVTDRLHRISCPTLVAGGRYDGIAPVANSEAIAARVPGADLRLYEGGHAFFAQDTHALPEIIEFLAR
jgi:pimeloyl-ACP methyl ester carboxylesterase